VKKKMTKSQIYASICTAVVVALLLTLLVIVKLTYPPADKSVWDKDPSEILYAGEYLTMDEIITVDQGNDDEPIAGEEVTGEEAAPGQASGIDLKDAGEEQGPVQPVQTTKVTSPVKVVEKPAPEKPATPRKTEEPVKKEEPAKASNINTDVTNAFSSKKNNSTGNNINAASNVNGGNTKSQASGISPGTATIGNGWSIARWGTVGDSYRTLTGSVIISVEVNASGKVVSATATGQGVAPAASNARVVEACRRASLDCQFQRKASATGEAPEKSKGTITWTFK
jgi:hypothetical protein